MATRNDPSGAGFLVEEFISSITTQLDRVQDALRVKAVNRPLTYALKELHLELKVFVDMDPTGQVRLRASGANEAGASVLAMDFTTITKPMIEENTISLAATRSTPLQKLGLTAEEQARLERLGVSNLAQLDRLRSSTGVSTMARLADVSVDRLRNALQAGLPRLGGVAPPKPPLTTQPPVATPPIVRPPVLPVGRGEPKTSVTFPPAPTVPAIPRGPRLAQRRLPDDLLRGLANDDAGSDTGDNTARDTAAALVIQLPATSRSLTLSGSNLLHEAYPPQVLLNGQSLEIEEADDDRLVVRLPEGFNEGALEVSLGDQPPQTFALVHEAAPAPAPDPWSPQRGRHEA